ncbi:MULTISPECIES: DUF3558 family protein [Streptomyces]|uniref:Lipoprotein n=1 Tax=Streptomyces katrae TaxID=68223 RepID=A0A0F4JAZ4_9ACTN|nr:DUF3558 family protein [Streptomyces katrae]KJY31385.1 hypothetical protein VR44_18200 [Streptomyces katrae]
MHRSASRLTRVLACAAVPVILTVAGCSSDSGKSSSASGSGKKSPSSSSSSQSGAKGSATLEKVAFAKLPDPCKSVPAKTVEALVHDAKDKNGTAAKSNDLANRASCSWNGLETDGTKGSQYRWLSVSLVRYDSHASLGSGNKRAEEQYNKQIELAKTTKDAHDVKVEQAGGVGDQGTSVVYGIKKDVDFFNTTVIARTQNVVITLDFNGAAYEGAGAPDQAKLLQDAINATKEVVTSVANGGTEQAPSGAESPSGSASPSASASPKQ